MKSDKNIRNALVVTACLVIVLGKVNAAAAEESPFKGRINGSFVGSLTENPMILLSHAQADGLATHVGAFTKVTTDMVNIVTGETDGVFTMTAANGDHLTGFYSGFTIPGAPGTLSWVLNATITGGTGRFSNATGTFVFTAQAEYEFASGALVGHYTETFDGTISY